MAWEPTVSSRFLAIFHTAIYDAWTAYDPVAVGVVSGTTLKNQGGLDNEANKREAISHAAYTVLRVLAPRRKHALTERMMALGYDPNANTAPAKVGRRAATAVLAACREDGANEAGNFADTTGYAPEKLTRPMHGNRSNFSENANFRRPRIGAGSYRLRCREPINFARLRRPRPEPTNGPSRSMC